MSDRGELYISYTIKDGQYIMLKERDETHPNPITSVIEALTVAILVEVNSIEDDHARAHMWSEIIKTLSNNGFRNENDMPLNWGMCAPTSLVFGDGTYRGEIVTTSRDEVEIKQMMVISLISALSQELYIHDDDREEEFMIVQIFTNELHSIELY